MIAIPVFIAPFLPGAMRLPASTMRPPALRLPCGGLLAGALWLLTWAALRCPGIWLGARRGLRTPRCLLSLLARSRWRPTLRGLSMRGLRGPHGRGPGLLRPRLFGLRVGCLLGSLGRLSSLLRRLRRLGLCRGLGMLLLAPRPGRLLRVLLGKLPRGCRGLLFLGRLFALRVAGRHRPCQQNQADGKACSHDSHRFSPLSTLGLLNLTSCKFRRPYRCRLHAIQDNGGWSIGGAIGSSEVRFGLR